MNKVNNLNKTRNKIIFTESDVAVPAEDRGVAQLGPGPLLRRLQADATHLRHRAVVFGGAAMRRRGDVHGAHHTAATKSCHVKRCHSAEDRSCDVVETDYGGLFLLIFIMF